MDYEKIYDETNKKEELDTPETKPEKESKEVERNTQKEPRELWDIAKKNVEDIEKEFQSLMRSPAVERAGKSDALLLSSLKGLGTVMVGLSTVLGGLLKLGNTFIPGFGLLSVPLAHALGGTRVVGQGLVDKGSPLTPINRVAPSNKKVD